MPLYEHFNTTNQTSPHFERHENFVTDIKLPTCALVQTLPYEKRCEYVRESGNCGENIFVVNYIDLLYCQINVTSQFVLMLGVLLLLFICIYLFITLGITTDGFFCPSLKVLSDLLHLNENVAGVTLLAFGNSAPDILTGIAGVSGETRTLYSDVFGAVTFVVFLVAGMIITLVPFDVQPTSILRDMLFLILDVCLIDLAVKSPGGISIAHGVFIIALYFFYIIVVLVDQYLVLHVVRDSTAIDPSAAAVSHLAYPHLQRIDIEEEIEEVKPPPMPAGSRLHSFYSAAMVMLSKLAFFKRKHAVRESPVVVVHFELESELERIAAPESKPEMELKPKRVVLKIPLLKQFFDSINPLNLEQWRKHNAIMRLLQLISLPVKVCLRLLIPVVDYELYNHGWSKLLTCIQLVVLPAALTMAIFGFYGYYGVPICAMVALIALPFSVYVFLVTTTDVLPKNYQYISILGTLGSIYVIYASASEIISILEVIGIITYYSNSFLGCTLLAWGNSVGDLIANVAIARQGYQRMGFAACLGGPLFTSLILIGSVFLHKSIHNEQHRYWTGEGTLGENNTVFLLLGLIFTLFAVITTNFALRRSIGLFMISIYLLYLIYAILGEMEYIHPYGSDHRLDMKTEMAVI